MSERNRVDSVNNQLLNVNSAVRRRTHTSTHTRTCLWEKRTACRRQKWMNASHGLNAPCFFFFPHGSRRKKKFIASVRRQTIHMYYRRYGLYGNWQTAPNQLCVEGRKLRRLVVIYHRLTCECARMNSSVSYKTGTSVRMCMSAVCAARMYVWADTTSEFSKIIQKKKKWVRAQKALALNTGWLLLLKLIDLNIVFVEKMPK